MTYQAKLDHVITLLTQMTSEHERVTFSNSFSLEDVLLTDLIAKYAPGIEVFTLDTGRLPAQTYELMQLVRDHYDIPIKVYYPNVVQLEALVTRHGPNAFYQSVEQRKACCTARKVEPLSRALKNKQVWLTGLRQEQAVTRGKLAQSEWDDHFQVQKVNPLFNWSLDEVRAYTKQRKLPYNALYDQGYQSIGCAPCSRAISEGEDVRAGRWWWENPLTKECGLHVKQKEVAA